MTISPFEFTVREITEGYKDLKEGGVFGLSGKLNIRPPYQREYIYKDKQRDEVIHTIRKKFPLNSIYWAKNDDGTYEVLDGQQRILSFCQYVAGVFSIDRRKFTNLEDDEKSIINDYVVRVFICEGTPSERLAWFKVINIAGVPLTTQELRNATYTGPWLADAKIRFSKTGCNAYAIAHDYIDGAPIRQAFLETALSWISKADKDKDRIDLYMADHQHDPNANELWLYFRSVIDWIDATFPHKRPFMKGINWGALYDAFGKVTLDTDALEKEIQRLELDDDVGNKSGIYSYILTQEQKHLNIRVFSKKQKLEAYARQSGICPQCNEHFEFSQMEGDHIDPWIEGGATTSENCQMLCKPCNRRKSSK